MHTNEPREDPLVDMGYETRDLNIKGIRKASIAFFGFAFACFGVVILWYWTIGPGQQHRNETPANARLIPEKPNPLLQSNVTAKVDIMTLRQAETKVLEGTGYVEGQPGYVHIPIDRAIDLVAAGQVPISTGRSIPATNPGNTTDGRPATATAAPATPGNGQ